MTFQRTLNFFNHEKPRCRPAYQTAQSCEGSRGLASPGSHMVVALRGPSLPHNAFINAGKSSVNQLRCQASLSDGKQPSRLRQAAKLLGGGLLAAGVLVAALPSLMSTRLGLSASLAAANLLAPGQVEVAKLEVGWSSPLRVQGLRLRDRQARGATPLVEVQEISCRAGLWQLLHAASFSSSASASAASSSAEGVAPTCLPLVVQEASFNLEYDPVIEEFKLVDWLERAGLTSPAPGTQAQPRPHALTGDSAARQAGERGEGFASASAALASHRGGRAPGPEAKGRVAEMLSRADAAIDFSADLRLGRQLQLLLPHGQLQVPRQVRDMVGSQLHVTGALGTEALKEWAGETEQDISWAVPGPASTPLPAGAGGGHGEGPAVLSPESLSRQEASTGAAAAPRVEHVTRPTNPAGYQPGMIQANSAHVQAEARLYCRDRGAGPILLHEPATATLEFTPALSRFGLEMINPLLSNAVDIKGGQAGGAQPSSAVRVHYAPDDLQLPPRGARLTVMPMRLTLGSGSRIQEICAAMNIGKSVSQLGTLEVHTSGMQVHLSPGKGPITTDRVDMSISPTSGTGSLFELSIWGTHDVGTGALDMTLGLPAGVLKQLGIRELPEGYLLPVQMEGTVDKPEVGYEGLVRRLAGLMVRQQYLAATQQQEKLRLQEHTQAGILGKVLKAISSVPLEMDAVKQVEAEMRQDLANTPQPWASSQS